MLCSEAPSAALEGLDSPISPVLQINGLKLREQRPHIESMSRPGLSVRSTRPQGPGCGCNESQHQPGVSAASMYLIGLTLEGQFSSRMQGVGDSLVLSPFPSFPSNSSAQGHSQLEAPSGHPQCPRGSVIHRGGFNNHGAKCPRAPTFSFPHLDGTQKGGDGGGRRGRGDSSFCTSPTLLWHFMCWE